MQKWNKEFDVENIGTNCFNIVLVDDVCDDNFSDCINPDGQLKYDTELHCKSVECSLVYSNDKIVLGADAVINFNDDSFDMKGVFLTTDSGYIMGYCINQVSLTVTNSMTFEEGFIFYDIVEGACNGE